MKNRAVIYARLSREDEDKLDGNKESRSVENQIKFLTQYAFENGFDYFTTTLSVSPLKDAKRLNQIGQALAEKYNVKYLPSDFKKQGGYLRSIQLSKQYDLYRQNYCGCSFAKQP